jgi:DNA topoisomerase-2
MAQNYMGSNNINLLEPRGQFGTRLNNGADSASERYIFTCLNPLTRHIFPEADDAILSYLNDDGTIVEPEYYVPILPFALINGITGIGTGFSCTIAPYNPKTIIGYLKNKLADLATDSVEFVPYYEGFKGTITKIANEPKYLIRGVYEKMGDDKIRITELPVGTATMPYITFLEELLDGSTDKTGKKIPPAIRDMTSLSTEVAIDILVHFPKGRIAELEEQRDANGINGIEKMLKLTTTVSTTNMHMFNADCKLHKYASVEEIIDDFYTIRLATYQKRKEYLIQELRRRLVKLSNRAKYILETLDGKIDLRRKTATQVRELMEAQGFERIEGDFKYLIKMPMDSVTNENVEHILKEKADTETELTTLLATTLETIWLKELVELETSYDKYKLQREQIQRGETTSQKVKIVKKKILKK